MLETMERPIPNPRLGFGWFGRMILYGLLAVAGTAALVFAAGFIWGVLT